MKSKNCKRRIDEYTLWFSDHAENNVRRLYEMCEGDFLGLYNSRQVPRWSRNIDSYKTVLETCEKESIRLCCLEDEDYPSTLREIFDPPYVLYYKGRISKPGERTCSIVGARKATVYGRKTATYIARILGRAGVLVISGMALGADSCAHKGCLEGGGRTAAVLGSGVDLCTPPSNQRLMDEILEKDGCVLSEFKPGTPGYASNYPRRNRIISGMGECLVVTEASERSGTAITANLALDQGRDVFAVPGNISSIMSRGTNRLIRDGAIPVVEEEDVLDWFGIGKNEPKAMRPVLEEKEAEIYEDIEKNGPSTPEELALRLKMRTENVSAILTVMEIKGLIFREAGKIIVAK